MHDREGKSVTYGDLRDIINEGIEDQIGMLTMGSGVQDIKKRVGLYGRRTYVTSGQQIPGND